MAGEAMAHRILKNAGCAPAEAVAARGVKPRRTRGVKPWQANAFPPYPSEPACSLCRPGAPAWVETNKEIRTTLLRARADLVHSWGLSLLRAAPDPAALTAARHLPSAEDPAAPAAVGDASDAASDAAAVAAAAAPAAVPWEYDAGKPKQVWPARVVEPVGSEEVRAAAEAASATATATARAAAQAREG
eukprot:scaffold22941_cov40-Phaeocystis_antarctica.AAC.2